MSRTKPSSKATAKSAASQYYRQLADNLVAPMFYSDAARHGYMLGATVAAMRATGIGARSIEAVVADANARFEQLRARSSDELFDGLSAADTTSDTTSDTASDTAGSK